MTDERIQELESIGFDWETSQTDWIVRFEQLREYKAEFGNIRVPCKYSANPKLGTWVMTQRRNYKLQQEGKTSTMPAERIRALESIGFDWETSKTDWSVRFQQLCEFKTKFGHYLVSRTYPANPTLGLWVSRQRSYYKVCQEGKRSLITVKHIQALEDIGFDWGGGKFD